MHGRGLASWITVPALPLFVYSFIYEWADRLFPYLSYCELHSYRYGIAGVFL